jgi:hypothetical protein
MLIHANKRWPDSITTNLWPYAIRMASDAINNTPNMVTANKLNPIEVFTNTNVVDNPKHWKPFVVLYMCSTMIDKLKGHSTSGNKEQKQGST